MSAQLAYKTSATPAQFAFLSQPPPSIQKRRAALPSPPPCPPHSPPPPPQTPRSSAFANIANWAAHVQPGSPAPRSPQRRPSVSSSRRPSLTRRPSISHSRARSGSFVHLVDTQSTATPSVTNFDLTNHGYTTLFVHLPKTPTTPSPYLRQYNQIHRAGQPAALHPKPAAVPLSASGIAFAHIPIPPIPQENTTERKRKGMKRFRSLSILRPKAKVLQPAPASPTKTAVSVKSAVSKSKKGSKPLNGSGPAPTLPASKEAQAEVIAKRKRAKYAYVRPPPTLANELAIMQFADGGNLESHVKRVMEAQAKAAAGSGASIGVADVYRDGEGGIWWDEDEELEYAHLLDGADSHLRPKDAMDVDTEANADMDMDWEEFDDGNVYTEPFSTYVNPTTAHGSSNKENADPEAPTRRSSLSTVDSDLDPKYLVPLPENEDPKLAPIDDRVLVSRRVGGAGMSVLSLPARPRRRALHLCKPTFLVDVKAWEGPSSPIPTGQSSPTRSTASPTKHVVGGGNATKLKGKARRRPAPLKLTPPSSSSASRITTRRPSVSASTPPAVVPASTVPSRVVPAVKLSPGGIERTRNEFIAASFAPEPVAVQVETALPRPSLAATTSDIQSMTMSSRAVTPSTTGKSAKSKLAMGVRGLFRRG
ncbi:hypothetical protein CPC08DRAFT_141749 [Agrocybe pediades]|nr:hypothetical protein CPC08DRAFT_141749 [Agrocybe pediades]